MDASLSRKNDVGKVMNHNASRTYTAAHIQRLSMNERFYGRLGTREFHKSAGINVEWPLKLSKIFIHVMSDYTDDDDDKSACTQAPTRNLELTKFITKKLSAALYFSITKCTRMSFHIKEIFEQMQSTRLAYEGN